MVMDLKRFLTVYFNKKYNKETVIIKIQFYQNNKNSYVELGSGVGSLLDTNLAPSSFSSPSAIELFASSYPHFTLSSTFSLFNRSISVSFSLSSL